MKQFLLFLLLIPYVLFSQNDADLDNTFNSNAQNFNSQIVENNGKIFIYSSTYVSPNYVGILYRLNNDGTIDNSFNFSGNLNSNGYPICIEVQIDGKIIVAGAYYNSNLKSINRFNSDGTIDTSFNLYQDIANIRAIKIQNDGKIIYGGYRPNNFGRINSDGFNDTTFLTGTNIYHSTGNNNIGITCIKIDNNGKILIGGNYDRYNGTSTSGLTRLNNDGSIDNSLTTGTGFNFDWVIVKDIELQSNGKIIVGGGFSSYNGSSATRLIRINSNGTKDITFNPAVNDIVNDIEIQTDGKIIVGGDFTIATGGISKNRLCRFNIDGTIDNTFNILTGFNNRITDITINSSNKILIGGSYTTYQGNVVNNIIRLKGTSNLSNEYFEQNKIKIYPNPVKETIYISNTTKMEYEIFDVLGKIVLKGSGNVNQINVNSLTKGIYFLKLKNEANTINQKFIKE
ncbi:T9SS type A sorting domain-containing protein [Flavobacterium sp. LB3R33]|uniref:T9SS type A sorting domain-containing protein n=1 Tax=Flavobacterium sp. LB3R33 TaxID=3401721 RepID=UPI003AAFBDA4